MSWQNILKAPIDYNAKSMEAIQAARTDESWEEYTKDITREKSQRIGDAKASISRNTEEWESSFKTLGVKLEDVIARLSKVVATRNTHERPASIKNWKKLVTDKKWEELLQMLSSEMTSRRLRLLLRQTKNLEISNALFTSEDENAKKIISLLYPTKEAFPTMELTTSISNDNAIEYVQFVLNKVNVNHRIPFISMKQGDNQSMRTLFMAKPKLKGLQYILENDAIDTSKLSKPMLRQSVGKLGLINDLINDSQSVKSLDNIQAEWKNFKDFVKEIKTEESDKTSKKVLPLVKRKLFFGAIDKNLLAKNELLMYFKGEGISEPDYDELIELMEDEAWADIDDLLNLGDLDTDEVEAKFTQAVQGAIRNMVLTPDKYRIPRSDDVKSLEFIFENEMEDIMDSLTEESLDESSFTTSQQTTFKDGVAIRNNTSGFPEVVRVLEILGELFSAGEDTISTFDYMEGEITREKFMAQVQKEFSEIKKDFLANVKENMKLVMSQGKRINKANIKKENEPYIFIYKMFNLGG